MCTIDHQRGKNPKLTETMKRCGQTRSIHEAIFFKQFGNSDMIILECAPTATAKCIKIKIKRLSKMSVIEWIDGWTDFAENEQPGGTFFLVYENAHRDAVFCANSVNLEF
jgi:hypothetical protein